MTIGPYQIIERIGTGGMAEVFLARHQGPEGLERLVALKRIVPSYARHPEIRAMFIDEARLLARLVHPYIVQIHDLHAAGDDLWLVTEYIKGPDLRTLLHHAQGGLPIEMAVRVALDVAEALAYAHARRDESGRTLGVVHRDLKPSNVMVRQDGVVKLLDFGVAKARARLHQTQVGAIKGSLGYFAPEQIQDPGRVDRRADIFAFGVVLYEALTGRHPFGPLDGPPVVMRMLAGDPRPPRALRPTLDPALDTLVLHCLQTDPADRPQRMEEVAEALAGQLRRPITFARLAEYVRDGVPSSTMRVALPRFMDADDPSISEVLDAEGQSVPGLIALDTLELDDPPPAHTPSVVIAPFGPAEPGGSGRAGPERPPRPHTGQPIGSTRSVPRAYVPGDLLDLDTSDPTTQMPAPTPGRPSGAMPAARPTSRDGAHGPPTDPGDEGETAVLDDDEMPTFVAEDARDLLGPDDEMPTFVAEGHAPPLTGEPTGRVQLSPQRPIPMMLILALAGIITGLVVALMAALLAE